ncbi:hypothetical protein ACJJI3_07490 [Microbulbifer sp. ZKSA004]|uniref:hypothetical protein n=1 Tax=Microbulbifer sp. ZKSA004 TaxID=3243389 RepID=UPI00403977DE
MVNMNIEGVMEYLFEFRVENLPAEALAEVFDRLIWCVADNGKEISIVQKKWLEGESYEKCSIALAMNEIFPYEEVSEMKEAFREITKKWPGLGSRCNEIINSRVKQNALQKRYNF